MRIRGDQIDWWHSDQFTVAQQNYPHRLEELWKLLNCHLYLSLVTQEAHCTIPPTNSLSMTQGSISVCSPECTVSTVFYLNLDWYAEEGGQLCLHLGERP